MKKIYIGHSSSFNFKTELYEPLRKSSLDSQFEIILPHENSDEQFNSKEALKECSFMIAEVSHPSTGLGIELGWADTYGVPIIFIHKTGSKVSGALKVVSDKFIEYNNQDDMIEKIKEITSS